VRRAAGAGRSVTELSRFCAGKVDQLRNPNSVWWKQYAFYARDHWQISRKLTLTYGLRFEGFPVPRKDHTGINRFDPNFKPPPVPVLPSLHVTVYPNPSWRTRAGFELKLRGQATHYDGEIYDINGRLVHRFAIDGNDRQFWNGFDMNGRGVGAGVYFLRVRGGGAEATTRIVVLR